MENNNDFIAFDVDETLYFEFGQEISEMLSISLDPDVSLDMYEAYIQIHGIIVLNGAYRKVEKNDDERENEPYPDTLKYIEKIVDKNDQEAEFYHRFPVDISIPKERVNQLDDVNVMIAAFDYELQDHHTLKIKATIHINGLAEQTKPDIIEAQKTETIEYDTTKEEVEQSQRINDEQSQTDETYEETDESTTMSDETDMDEKKEKVIDISLSKTEESEETDEVKDVRFLTDLFGNTEETMQTTVTLYITQEEDTIEKIAKRFEIPTLQLIKDNDLSGEKITNGQLLHIQKK